MTSHTVRVLLDEYLPHDLRLELTDFDIQTVAYAGVAGLSNGALLAAMEDKFEVLVTMDGSIPGQQEIVGRSLCLIILRAPTNRLEDLLQLVPELNQQIENAQPGTICFVPNL